MENKTNLSDAPIIFCFSYNFITFSIAPAKNWKVTGAVHSKIWYKVDLHCDTFLVLMLHKLFHFLHIFLFLQLLGELERRLKYFFITRIFHRLYWYYIAVALTVCFILWGILSHDITFNVNYHISIVKYQFQRLLQTFR